MMYPNTGHDHSGNVAMAPGRGTRSGGSRRTSESIEGESTAGPSINYKELAAEIAAHIRQDTGQAERGRPTQDGLPAVAESAVGSGAESTRSRQLPRPPPTVAPTRLTDTRSIDTLPAYVPGQSR